MGNDFRIFEQSLTWKKSNSSCKYDFVLKKKSIFFSFYRCGNNAITPNIALLHASVVSRYHQTCVATQCFPHEVSLVLTVTTALWESVHAANHNSRNLQRFLQPSKGSGWNSFEKMNENEVQCKLCRVKLTLARLEKLYDDNTCLLRSHLTSVEKLSLTTDSWTALTTESYVTVTFRYFSKRKIQRAALQTEAVLEQHTAENLVNLW